MGHKCTSPHCKRRTGERCDTGRVGGHGRRRMIVVDALGKPVKPEGRRPHATPHEKGAAVDMYFDGLSYRRIAGNMEQYFGRETSPMTVYRWVRESTGTADEILRPMKVNTGPTWVADEMVVNVGGEKMWLFNVMDSDTRFVLAAYLTPHRTARSAQTTLALARERSANPPAVLKTDGLRSYRQALPRAFPTHPVKPTVSQGIKAEINNNRSERLQGTFRDRDKTLRGLDSRETGQAYIDGLVLHYNYFRPHESLKDQRPAAAAGAEIPFRSWADVAAVKGVKGDEMEVGKVKPGIHRGAYRTLPYYGGKRGGGKGEWIAGLLPSEKNSCYIEPFAGMAGVLLARPPVKVEILNDLNGRLVNWWRVVRDQPEEFGWLVEHTPISRDKYTWAARAVDDPELPAIRRSLAFHILLDQSPVASDSRLSPGGWGRKFTPAVGSIANHSKKDIQRLSARLRKVQLENGDAVELLKRTAACDYAVIYCDPPYPTADTTPYSFGNIDYPALADLLRAQQGAVAVSGYPGEWDNLGWTAEYHPALHRKIGSGVEPRTEVLWRNDRCVELATVRHLL